MIRSCRAKELDLCHNLSPKPHIECVLSLRLVPELANILTKAGPGAGAGETLVVSMMPGSVEAPRKVKPGNSADRSFLSCKWHADYQLSASFLSRRLLIMPLWQRNRKPDEGFCDDVRA
jgi:hypothetical protein